MTDDTTIEETREERYERLERERQEKYEAERAADRKKFDQIEGLIKPLKFAEYKAAREDDPFWNYCSRDVVSEDGERLGHIRLDTSGYSYKRNKRWTVSSPRIPTRSRYSYGEGKRRYKHVDTAANAIKKFCIPVSDDEQRADVLRRELKHYRNVVEQAYRRSLTTDGSGYTGARVDGFIRLLASDIPQDRIEGEEYIRVLVRKRRVHNRWSAWVKVTFIDPRQTELEGLDTSKEKIS